METTCLYLCAVFFLFSVTPALCDTGVFWHVTDFHYDHTYGTTGLSCNEKVNMSGYYGDYWCDAPWTLIEESVNSMKALKADPDFILWTGDNVAHIKDEDLSEELNLEILQNITNALTAAFPNIPVYATLGNHDFWPANDAVRDDPFLTNVSAMWAHWIGNDSQVELFKKGGYYYRDPTPTVRILGLNTNYYYTKNKLTASMTDPAEQFAWMRDQLTEVRQKGMKAILTAHVTPGLVTPDLVDWLYPHFRKSIAEIMTQFSDVIVASHFGHDHGDGFKLIQNNDGSNAVTHFVAPSITPWRYKIPSETGDAHNPGMKLVKYDRVTGAHLDYDMYYINLTDSNNNMRADWKKLYTFTKAYRVSDMSPASLKKIFENMATPGNDYAKKYCRYHVVSRFEKECTNEMQADIYCGGLFHTVDDAKRCKTNVLSSAPGSVNRNANLLNVGTVALVSFLFLHFPQ